MSRIVWLAALALAACDEEPLAGPDPSLDDIEKAGNTQLWWTCGDPVCGGWSNHGLPACHQRQAGDACNPANLGKACDPHDACNADLVCSDTDPTVNGCPISVRSAKKEIRYLSADDTRRAHDDLMGVHLATWRYNQESEATPTHLGFIIDDVGRSPMVTAEGGHVDLYGYTSMTVAAVQEQQKEIDGLQAQIRELQAQLAAR